MPVSAQLSTQYQEKLKGALSSAQSSDWSFAFDILEYLEKNPDKAAEFGKDPEAYVRAKGMKLPTGYHLHYIDADGNRYPEEKKMEGPSVRPLVEITDGIHTLGVCIGICTIFGGSC